MLFRFQLQTKIAFGCDTLSSIWEEVKNPGGRKVLVVTDRRIFSTGAVNELQRILNHMGIECCIYDQGQPNPESTIFDLGAQ